MVYIDPTVLKIIFVLITSICTFLVGYALWKMRNDD